MALAVRGIYQNGKLTLLDPVNLEEGQTVLVTLVEESQTLRDVLADLISPPDVNGGDDLDEAALMREIDEQTNGITVSDLIIEERRSGR